MKGKNVFTVFFRTLSTELFLSAVKTKAFGVVETTGVWLRKMKRPHMPLRMVAVWVRGKAKAIPM